MDPSGGGNKYFFRHNGASGTETVLTGVSLFGATVLGTAWNAQLCRGWEMSINGVNGRCWHGSVCTGAVGCRLDNGASWYLYNCKLTF